jgi:hypothetical protein
VWKAHRLFKPTKCRSSKKNIYIYENEVVLCVNLFFFLKKKENFIKNYFRLHEIIIRMERKICRRNQFVLAIKKYTQTQNIVHDWIGKPIKSPPGLPQQPKKNLIGCPGIFVSFHTRCHKYVTWFNLNWFFEIHFKIWIQLLLQERDYPTPLQVDQPHLLNSKKTHTDRRTDKHKKEKKNCCRASKSVRSEKVKKRGKKADRRYTLQTSTLSEGEKSSRKIIIPILPEREGDKDGHARQFHIIFFRSLSFIFER